jgi:hypothetical protein
MLLVFIGCPLKNQDDPFCSSPLKNQDDPFVSTTEKARWPRLQHALKNQDDPLCSSGSRARWNRGWIKQLRPGLVLYAF